MTTVNCPYDRALAAWLTRSPVNSPAPLLRDFRATGAVINFTREFTQGNLVGLTHDDSMRFQSANDAVQWAKAVNENNARGAVDYKIVAYSVNF